EGEFDVEARRGRLTTDLGSLIGMFEGPTGESMAGEMDMVVDGDTVYVRSPLFAMISEGDEEWVSLPAGELDSAGGFGSGTTSDPGAFLSFLEGAGTVEEVGTEDVRGVATTHVRADLDMAKVLEQAPAQDGEDLTEQLEGLGLDPDDLGTVPAEAWIDGDGHVRRFTMTYDLGALGGEEAEDVSTTIDVELYDFDQPVEIELPDPSEVGELDPSMLPDSGD
ncbi:MAG TPA: hypothetical protein VHK88_16515, partial [Aquihabitans sp.]|nr:hypothetical protein [Aquihabitans sp.]